jgi:DNA-binding transcriptional ArsR family regulator
LKKAVHIVDNSKEIQILANFIHRKILQLLSEHPITQTELSKILRLTKSAIGYHLKQLMQANLIYIKRVEVESHGIQQKFYSPIANFIIASHERGQIFQWFPNLYRRSECVRTVSLQAFLLHVLFASV